MINENWILCRKPLAEKTIADNVLKYGTGGINIDGSRIEFKNENDKQNAKPGSLNASGEYSLFGLKSGNEQNELGRFPANFIYCSDDDVIEEFSKSGVSKSGKKETKRMRVLFGNNLGEFKTNVYGDEGTPSRFFFDTKE